MFNNSTQKEKKSNNEFSKKEKKLRNILSTQTVPSLNLNFFSNTNDTSSPITPPPTPNTASSSNTSLSADSSFSSIEEDYKKEGPQSLGMVRSKPLSDFHYTTINTQKESEEKESLPVQYFKK